MSEDKRREDDTRQVIEDIGQGAKSTVVLQGKILKKIYRATLGAIGRRFKAATGLGKLFILAGLIGALGLGFLIARQSLEVDWTRSDQVRVTAAEAAIRRAPDEQATPVSHAAADTRLAYVGEANSWWSVRQAGRQTPGWIAKQQARLEKRVRIVIEYQMTGFGLGLLGALLLMCVGFWLRKRD